MQNGWDLRARNKKIRQTRTTEMDFWTPPDLFAAISREFGPFTLDAAASAENTKTSRFYTEAMNALERRWRGTVWCNPPYRREMRASFGTKSWIAKAVEETRSRRATKCVLLIPAYTDLASFHELVLPNATHIIYIKARVRFEGPNLCAGVSARHPSMVVVFESVAKKRLRVGSMYRDGSQLTWHN